MEQVDVFIFLNDVQFSKRSWQQRNLVRISEKKTHWLTVPVIGGTNEHTIDQIKIDSGRPWKRKHMGAIRRIFARAPAFSEINGYLEEWFKEDHEGLKGWNVSLIRHLAGLLEVNTEVYDSLDLDSPGCRESKLVELCRQVGADRYLSPVGSYEYLAETDIFEKAGIPVVYQHFEHPVYEQLLSPFMSHLSIIDLLYHVGPQKAGEILRSGIRPPTDVPVKV